MAIELDGFAFFSAIASHRDVFVSLKADASVFARKFVEKKLKEKTVSLATLVQIASALGTAQFSSLVEGMSDAAIKALIAKTDKHNPDYKNQAPHWRMSHVKGLASGEVTPSPPPTRAPRTRTRPAPTEKVERAINLKSTRARRKTPSD